MLFTGFLGVFSAPLYFLPASLTILCFVGIVYSPQRHSLLQPFLLLTPWLYQLPANGLDFHLQTWPLLWPACPTSSCIFSLGFLKGNWTQHVPNQTHHPSPPPAPILVLFQYLPSWWMVLPVTQAKNVVNAILLLFRTSPLIAWMIGKKEASKQRKTPEHWLQGSAWPWDFLGLKAPYLPTFSVPVTLTFFNLSYVPMVLSTAGPLHILSPHAFCLINFYLSFRSEVNTSLAFLTKQIP